jgi:ATP-dependent Clp protease ATP-binding subunit ClpC
VLLLDEIEKAHPAVFDLLLQVLGEGRLTDARGRTTHFGNTIIIMTSNLGASHRPTGSGSGFGGAEIRDGSHERRYYAEQVDRHFRPEFVNRIDSIIPFASLDRAEIAQVARVSLQRIRERAAFAQRGISLEVSDAALADLATRGFSPIYGARALRRQLEDHLVAPIAGMLSAAGALAEGATIVVGLGAAGLAEALAERRAETTQTHGELGIAIVSPPASRAPASGIARFSRLRRNAAAALRSPVIEELRQRWAYLTAELAGQTQGEGAHARAHALASLREHQRIDGAIVGLDAAMVAIETVEELAAGDTYGEQTGELAAEADAAHAAFELAVVSAIFVGDARDAITIGLTAPTTVSPLPRWLTWLAAWGEDRKWNVTVHREGELGADWPSALPWGPPRELTRVRDDFAAMGDSAPWRNLLLRVHGPHCGWLLGLEAGLHRFWPADRASADHLVVRAISSRTGLGQLELGSKDFAPMPRNPSEALHRMPAVRECFADGIVTLPQLDFTTLGPVDLGAPGVLERLWFGELVRRSRDGLDLADDLAK